ncbi:MAG: tetratricopeptide repeat protein [Cyanobacteria bacterium P01_A01_bin.114]
MGTVIEVDQQTFAAEVLQRSADTVVLVDFFAQWCGPCKLLGPLLEKLAGEYDFVLAKVDIDQNPELANTYGVEGVPDVRRVSDGTVSEGFVGALDEAQLRSRLAQLGISSGLERGLAEFARLRATGDKPAIAKILNQLIGQYPESAELMLAAADYLIAHDRLEDAQKLIGQAALRAPRELNNRVEGMKSLLNFKQALAQPPAETEPDKTYRIACKAAVDRDYETALTTFLAIVENNAGDRKDAARKAMIGIFNLLGDDSDLTRTYRKKLMQALY